MLDDWRRFQQLAHVFHSGTICTIFFVRRHFKQGNACTVKGLIVALVVVVVVVHLSSSLQCSPWSQKVRNCNIRSDESSTRKSVYSWYDVVCCQSRQAKKCCFLTSFRAI